MTQTNKISEFTITLPVSDDALGRWLEDHGGSIQIGCSLGIYSVHVGWRKLHSYSDTNGQHSENWELSRHGRDLATTLREALEAAIAREK